MPDRGRGLVVKRTAFSCNAVKAASMGLIPKTERVEDGGSFFLFSFFQVNACADSLVRLSCLHVYMAYKDCCARKIQKHAPVHTTVNS